MSSCFDATPRPSSAHDISESIWQMADAVFQNATLVAADGECVEIIARAFEEQLRAAWELGRKAWCPAGVLDDAERTERDWQQAITHLSPTEPRKQECSYCGTTDCLRVKSDGGMSALGFTVTDLLFTCESCFTPQDDGPCFDDLPEVSP